MKIEELISRTRKGERVAFEDTVRAIDAAYRYTPTGFTNGLGEDTVQNPPGVNEGSCKIFSFARLHELTEAETLALFGDHFWKDVLENPQGDDHRNIRTFMKHGWSGIHFEGQALAPRIPERDA